MIKSTAIMTTKALLKETPAYVLLGTTNKYIPKAKHAAIDSPSNK